jgi:lysophospholipase L1-like esterase
LSTAATLSSSQTLTAQPRGLLVDYGNTMHFFHQALRDYSSKDGNTGMIRIAYVGDSQIEGDVITKDLRALFQGRFGGMGTGFMKIIAEDAPFRTDFRHTFSDDWIVQPLTRYSARGPFWLGPVFVSGKGSWVNYEVAGRSGSDVDCCLLHRGDGSPRRIFVSVNNGPETALDLEPAEGMHNTKVHGRGEGALKKIRITFPDGGIKAYGVSFQRETGVYVDNYSLRGHKGLELGRVSPDVAGQMLRYSPYKLIILQFGVNVAYAEADGFRLYERGLGGVISHLRQLFPEAAILVVSATDRCVKDGEAIVSDAGVPELMQAQLRAAAKEGVAFFDLYRGMGGAGAMQTWVRDGYAVKDYTHISRRGGKKIADLLYGTLLEAGYKP